MQEKSESDSRETAESSSVSLSGNIINVNKYRSNLIVSLHYITSKYYDSLLMQSISTIEYYRIRAFFTYNSFLNIQIMQEKSVGMVGDYGKMASE